MALAVALIAAVVPVPGRAFAEPPAPLGGREWWFDAWHVFDVWEHTQGVGVTVAIIDSGVNASLPDFDGHVVSGEDLTGQGGDGRQDFDLNSHGTVMAALMVSQGRSTHMLGIAPGATVMPISIGVSGELAPDVTASAIRFAVDHGAKVVNMSYGVNGVSYPNGCAPDVANAVRYAIDHDVVLVAAAGNDGDSANAVGYPAACPGVLSVGAVDRHAQAWVKSARHDYVDVAAPGVDTVAFDRFGREVGGAGTSDAAALTSGAVALLRAEFPQLSGRQIVARLLATLGARPPAGTKDLARGYGTIKLLSAVTKSVPVDAPNPVYDELDALSTPSPADPAPPPPRPSLSPAASGSHGYHGPPAWAYEAGGALVTTLLVVLLIAATTRSRRRPAWQAGPGAQPYPPPTGWPSTSLPPQGAAGPGYPPAQSGQPPPQSGWPQP